MTQRKGSLSLSLCCCKSVSPCSVPCQNALHCKSALSEDCAGGEPDSFSIAGRVGELRRTRSRRSRRRVHVCVCGKYSKEDERNAWTGGGSRDRFIQPGMNELG